MVEANILVSALAGAGSFFSPCILPILPAFISYLSGTTIKEVRDLANSNTTGNVLTVRKSARLNIFLNTVYFILGFSLMFAVLGVILNSLLSSAGIGFQSTLQWIGGVIIIVFGVYLILSTKLRSLNFEKKISRIPKDKLHNLICFWL
jgi:cytochrome c-type biogenesis protein